MGLIELFILAVGLSMDAFAVSVCKGLAMPKISFKKAAIVGLWFGGFQALMPALGYLLGVQFQDKITEFVANGGVQQLAFVRASLSTMCPFSETV